VCTSLQMLKIMHTLLSAQADETLARVEQSKAGDAAAAKAVAAAAPQSGEAGEQRCGGRPAGDGAAASASAAAAAALGNAPAAAPKAARHSRRASAKGPPAVTLPDVTDDPFELPSAAKKRSDGAVDAEAEKERVGFLCFVSRFLFSISMVRRFS